MEVISGRLVAVSLNRILSKKKKGLSSFVTRPPPQLLSLAVRNFLHGVKKSRRVEPGNEARNFH